MCSIENILSISCLDVFAKISMVFIAIFNLIFAIFIFYFKNKKDDNEKEKDRRLVWLKSLILDQNLKYFYEFFDLLEVDLIKLKEPNLIDDDKISIETKIADHFIKFRRKFIDLILAVDEQLYDKFINSSDELQEHITRAIFDSGINLSHSPKFDEILSEKLTTTKTDLVKMFFDYRG